MVIRATMYALKCISHVATGLVQTQDHSVLNQVIKNQNLLPNKLVGSQPKTFDVFIYLFIYLGFYTVQVISRWVVLWADEPSAYSWSRFCTVNCRPLVSNIRSGV